MLLRLVTPIRPRHLFLSLSTLPPSSPRIEHRNTTFERLKSRLGTRSDSDPTSFSTPQGRAVTWHSSAHVLGWALEELGGDAVHLQDGPPLPSPQGEMVAPGTGGFFYEFKLEEGREEEKWKDPLPALQALVNRKMKTKYGFERLEMDEAEDARELFRGDPEKIRLIEELGKRRGTKLSAYRVGEFVDLCTGPHVANAGEIGYVFLTKFTAGHEKGVHRVYGISFPTKAELVEYKAKTELAKQRDHRVLGAKQKLFAFHEASPGSVFFLPHGQVCFNRLISMLRDEYVKRGFEEVSSPLLYQTSLWEKSGHLEHYAKDMFFVNRHRHGEQDKVEENTDECHGHSHVGHGEGAAGEAAVSAHADDFGLKPMNCPGHCIMFSLDGSSRSYKSMPVRFADFSALHRNELSGTLSGLTRLRRFHQDDAHIFCTRGQIEGEIASALEFLCFVYEEKFGFQMKMNLSTRPEKSVGSDESWNKAETALRKCLENTKKSFGINEGDGSFYGPKIDIDVFDAVGRAHQCGTIQLDFQMPERFKLEFMNDQGQSERPVMIHRAVLGSVERFFAILLEHTNGKLPFWLSPRQVCVVPVVNDDDRLVAYANTVRERLATACRVAGDENFCQSKTMAGLCVDVDYTNDTLSKKIRNAQQSPYSLIAVVGAKEIDDQTVSVRTNDGTMNKTVKLDDIVKFCAESVAQRDNATVPRGLLG